MYRLSIFSRGGDSVLARFFTACALVVIFTLGTGIADASPADKPGDQKPGHEQNQGHKPGHNPDHEHNPGPVHNPDSEHNPGHGHNISDIRQALSMKDKTQVTVIANITKSLGGNRYIIADKSGSCEAQIGPKELDGLRVQTHDPVTIQGEIKKDKNTTRINVKQIIVQQHPGQNPDHGQNISDIRHALNMNNKTQVTIVVNIVKSLGGNRYVITDKSGLCEAQIGPKELDGLQVPTHDPVTIQGEIRKDKDTTRIHVKQIIDQHNPDPNPDHGQNTSVVRQVMLMKNKTQVIVIANITKRLGGNRYIIEDQSGSCEAQIAPKELEGLRVPTHNPVTIRGEIKKDNNSTRINVKQIIIQQHNSQNPGPGPNHGSGHNPGPGQNPGPNHGHGQNSGPDKSKIISVTPSAEVEKLKGNRNNLTITIIEEYADGRKERIEKTFSIKNNAADTYEVGSYKVYVDTKGNDQIRACRIVN